MQNIKQRSTIDYNEKETDSIKRKLEILKLQIDDKSHDGVNTIFDNQNKCGEEICKVFQNKSIINCLVYGMTQTGKTGCMTAVIKNYCSSNLIPINNIYIITGLSDKEWRKDTKFRMPDSINQLVLHRTNLNQDFLEDIIKKKNVLIIMDEIQYACKNGQTIQKIFKKCGFYNLERLMENDIKLIQFSATPDGHVNDINEWEGYSANVKLPPGEGYYGAEQAIKQGRVKQFKNLIKDYNVRKLKKYIKKTFVDPRYHLIRVPSKKNNNQSKVVENFKNVFKTDYNYNSYYLEKEKDDINDILKIKPNKHTFIFICEILRCAKTQYKKYIGVSYERYTSNPNDSSMIQGLFGRTTGYDDNGDSICFTNRSSIINYIKLWENNMEFPKGLEWNTDTTRYNKKNNRTTSQGKTFNSVKNIPDLKDNYSHEIKVDRGPPKFVRWFGEDGQNKMKEYFKKHLQNKMGKKGPKIKFKNKDGFYEASLRYKSRAVLSFEEVEKDKQAGLNSTGPCYRSYPCYLDIKDPSTLNWCLIYYEN